MPGLRETARLAVADVTAPVDPAWLPFQNTDELPVLDAIFGQERAVRAIEFALGMDANGYNLFASGPDGFGKSAIVESFLRRRARQAPAPLDWVYVHNFNAPDHPIAISLPSGHGPGFAAATEETVTRAVDELRSAFDSDAYARQRQDLADQLERNRTEVLEGLQNEARDLGFALQFGPQGILSAPLIEGRPATEEQFQALPEEQRHAVEQHREDLEKKVQDALLKIRALDRGGQERADALDDQVAAYAIGHLFEGLREQYAGDEEIRAFLEAVETDLRGHRERIRGQGQAPVIPGLTPPQGPPLKLYEVNVLVTNDPQVGAPVVFERHPTYYNLVGRIEYQGQFGTMSTDHTMIKAGSLARANGGYLVIRLRDLLANAVALDGLKRSLAQRELLIENLSEAYSLVPTTGLRPEPIPLETKVVIIGEAYLYSLLYRYDPDFRELFRIKADFEEELDRTAENVRGLSSVIRAECDRRSLLCFSADAIARLVEHSSRMVEDRRKLSANMAAFLDIARQSDFWARQAGASEVSRAHVDRALDEVVFRSALFRDRIVEAMKDGTIRVETEGVRAGEINALSVYDLGDIEFGRPSRISCVTSAGRGTIVMVERESEMAGRIHNKGFLILRGFLANRFGQDKAASLHASLTFEQLYGDIDGDSASSTELYSLLSSLSEQPLAQFIAVTGSVDQLGRVQPIGGATAKIEGFFEVCRARGLTGQQGVMIPRSNVPNVILRPEVARAIAEGQFHVWAIDTIEEGIELLTGVPAGGARGEDGHYPTGTIYRMVEDRLEAFAREMAEKPAVGAEGHVPMPTQAYPTPPGIPPSPPPEPPVIV